MKTVKDLRKAGFVVKVRHNRVYTESKGGSTEVAIYKGRSLITEGYSKCCGIDNYNKKLGTRIALGRALKNLSKVSRLLNN